VAKRKKTKVFVSYSRHDEALVRPLAGLLGVAADDAVFLDVTSLKPGDLWDDKIMGAVKEASVFVLCWCCESDKSTFIAKEISAALAEGEKKLVPVLFCSTPLPPGMADRQWIDLRGKVVHDCPLPHVEKKKPRRDSDEKMIPRMRQRPANESPEELFEESVEAEDSGFRNFPPAPQPVAPAAANPESPLPRTPAPSASLPRRNRGAYALAATVLASIVALATYHWFGTPPSAAPLPEGGHPQGAPFSDYLAIASVVGLAMAWAAFVLMRRSRSMQKRNELQRPEEIAAAAAAYFEGLGKKK
jgi:TIR domain